MSSLRLSWEYSSTQLKGIDLFLEPASTGEQRTIIRVIMPILAVGQQASNKAQVSLEASLRLPIHPESLSDCHWPAAAFFSAASAAQIVGLSF